MSGMTLALRVRYHECDPQGIAFNARYAEWADLATTELLRATLPGGVFGLDYRLKAQTVTWSGASRFDEVLTLTPEVRQTGNTSFRVFTTISAGSELRAEVETTYVRVEPATGRPTPLGPLADRLRAGAPGRRVDLADGAGRVEALPPGDPTPWGGGLTTTLWSPTEGVRLSLATIERPGPFSHLPGEDRSLLLLEGRLALRRADGLTLDPGLSAPVQFFGDDRWFAEPGPTGCRVLNLRVRRTVASGALQVLPPGRVEAPVAWTLAGGRVGGELFPCGQALAFRGGARSEVPLAAVALSGRALSLAGG